MEPQSTMALASCTKKSSKMPTAKEANRIMLSRFLPKYLVRCYRLRRQRIKIAVLFYKLVTCKCAGHESDIKVQILKHVANLLTQDPI